MVSGSTRIIGGTMISRVLRKLGPVEVEVGPGKLRHIDWLEKALHATPAIPWSEPPANRGGGSACVKDWYPLGLECYTRTSICSPVAHNALHPAQLRLFSITGVILYRVRLV